MKKLMKNYTTKNKLADAGKKDWCIAPSLGKPKQVTLRMNSGKSNMYACRFPVTEGAIAIVGRQFPYDCYEVKTGAATGAMGQVTEVSPKLTINKEKAMEIDYVFVENPKKKDLKQCEDFLSTGNSSYSKTLLADTPVRPITYHIRKILTAASVLAHSDMVSPVSLELAKTAICEKKMFERKMLSAAPTPFDPAITINEIHIPDPSVKNTYDEIKKQLDKSALWAWDNDGSLEEMSEIAGQFIALPIVNDYVNKYAHLGAISIMVRGGFKNLLAAYLSAEPPIEAYLTDALEILDGLGNQDTYALLEELK